MVLVLVIVCAQSLKQKGEVDELAAQLESKLAAQYGLDLSGEPEREASPTRPSRSRSCALQRAMVVCLVSLPSVLLPGCHPRSGQRRDGRQAQGNVARGIGVGDGTAFVMLRRCRVAFVPYDVVRATCGPASTLP